jgi:hypothetical protein
MVSGVVDPETLYTKQNCIGKPFALPSDRRPMLIRYRRWQLWQGLQRVRSLPNYIEIV